MIFRNSSFVTHLLADLSAGVVMGVQHNSPGAASSFTFTAHESGQCSGGPPETPMLIEEVGDNDEVVGTIGVGGEVVPNNIELHDIDVLHPLPEALVNL